MPKHHYVVQTKPCHEAIAHENIQAIGFEAYLPTVRVEVRTRLKRFTVLEPLFPSYLFVSMDLSAEPWRKVASAKGVQRILGVDGEHPTAVPDGALDQLRARFAAGEFTRGVQAPRVDVGDDVVVESGPFEGQIGKCVESRGERVKILLNLLGGEARVNVAADIVARRAAE
jgi:transcriptional antiterminator RfaH